MGGMSLWHWMIVLVVVLLLFGSGRLSSVMGDAAKGIKAFKKGMADDDAPATPAPPAPPAHLTQSPPAYQPAAPVYVPGHAPAGYAPGHVVPGYAPAPVPQPGYAPPPAGQPMQPAPAMQPAPGTEPRQP